MISETVNIVLKDLTLDDGKHPLTMEQISNRMANIIVTYDRDTDTIDILGNSKKGELAMEILERLNIDPRLLIGH